jgi:hypothetical protein
MHACGWYSLSLSLSDARLLPNLLPIPGHHRWLLLLLIKKNPNILIELFSTARFEAIGIGREGEGEDRGGDAGEL